ncbi:hypothetical protein EYF80_005996 [Liparis tanakae]|uniref:Uncharacterized protein n=1 Tax=Liparis tanakae TaxID=230148 RepID=A0A4Z2J0L5_9TELE|nr:hypothetical protein EYF80_005996 [Liparis tanakae]
MLEINSCNTFPLKVCYQNGEVKRHDPRGRNVASGRASGRGTVEMAVFQLKPTTGTPEKKGGLSTDSALGVHEQVLDRMTNQRDRLTLGCQGDAKPSAAPRGGEVDKSGEEE